MSILDLSALPAPQVLEPLDYEELYQRKLALFRLAMGENWTAALESDPVVKQLELVAYGDMQMRARINDAAKALLLAHAKGSDLDHLAANVKLARLVIQAGDPQAVPPLEEVKESDDALRERVQLAYEGLTTAGPRNSYILHARSASALVADASAESPAPACVTVSVLSLEGDGTAGPELLAAVARAVNDDDVRPVADRVTVQSAQVLRYRVDAVLHMKGPGPESDAALVEAERRFKGWMNPRRRLGVEVARSAIDAQLHVAGVARVELVGWQDLAPTQAQAAYCTGFSIKLGA